MMAMACHGRLMLPVREYLRWENELEVEEVEEMEALEDEREWDEDDAAKVVLVMAGR